MPEIIKNTPKATNETPWLICEIIMHARPLTIQTAGAFLAITLKSNFIEVYYIEVQLNANRTKGSSNSKKIRVEHKEIAKKAALARWGK